MISLHNHEIRSTLINQYPPVQRRLDSETEELVKKMLADDKTKENEDVELVVQCVTAVVYSILLVLSLARLSPYLVPSRKKGDRAHKRMEVLGSANEELAQGILSARNATAAEGAAGE